MFAQTAAAITHVVPLVGTITNFTKITESKLSTPTSLNSQNSPEARSPS